MSSVLLVLITATLLLTMEMLAVSQANDTDAFSLLHDMANPNGQLGWSEDAQGVTLPDSEAIQDSLTPSQEDDIVQQTIRSIDSRAFPGMVFQNLAQDSATTKTPAAPSPTPDAQVAQWNDLVSQLASHGA